MEKKNVLLYIAIPVAIILIVAAITVINKRTNTTMGAPISSSTTTEQNLEPIKEAEAGDLVVVHYTGTLENGTKFDSSYDRGQPFGFLLGQGMVITGWDEGLVGVKRGDKKQLVVPGEKAYGNQDIPGPDGKVLIPKNSTLIFEIEVVEVMAKSKVDQLIKEQQAMQAAASTSEQQ
ncbi:MAG: FKBP-type peptidyl-prolyl cis-trans isomerase [Patescibacteria group bacterium]